MRRILFYSLAASAICAMAMSNAEAASQNGAAAAKLKTVGDRQLYVNEPSQPYVGSVAGDNLTDRDGWRLHNGNWDNSCFRTLNYLSSLSFCTGGF